MPAFISVGRFLFALLFIVSGALHLLDLAGTTEAIAAKVMMPAAVTEYVTQLEGITGMPMAQMLADECAADDCASDRRIEGSPPLPVEILADAMIGVQ